MPYYAVIDTNVIISALLSKKADSETVKIINSVFTGDIIPVLHSEIIDEYKEVLQRAKFNLEPHTIFKVLSAIQNFGIEVYPIHTDEIFIDIDDRIFYEAALAINAYLITGNKKHYPASKFILSPAEMLNIINHDLTLNTSNNGEIQNLL